LLNTQRVCSVLLGTSITDTESAEIGMINSKKQVEDSTERHCPTPPTVQLI